MCVTRHIFSNLQQITVNLSISCPSEKKLAEHRCVSKRFYRRIHQRSKDRQPNGYRCKNINKNFSTPKCDSMNIKMM